MCVPAVVRQVECDAAFDVVPKVEVPQRCQGDVEDDDHKHPDVQNHGEPRRLFHLVL